MIYCQDFQNLPNLKRKIKLGFRYVGFDKLSRLVVPDPVTVSVPVLVAVSELVEVLELVEGTV